MGCRGRKFLRQLFRGWEVPPVHEWKEHKKEWKNEKSDDARRALYHDD